MQSNCVSDLGTSNTLTFRPFSRYCVAIVACHNDVIAWKRSKFLIMTAVAVEWEFWWEKRKITSNCVVSKKEMFNELRRRRNDSEEREKWSILVKVALRLTFYSRLIFDCSHHTHAVWRQRFEEIASFLDVYSFLDMFLFAETEIHVVHVRSRGKQKKMNKQSSVVSNWNFELAKFYPKFGHKK